MRGEEIIFIKTEIKKTITGKGLFSLEFVKKGSLIANFAQDAKGIITEEEYQLEQKKGNQLIIMSAIRWVDKYFLYGDYIGSEEYINHSYEPSMLYHCGICIAARDMKPGDELTVNYQYFLAENDLSSFSDHKTGKLVDGLPPKIALLKSAQELVKLLTEL